MTRRACVVVNPTKIDDLLDLRAKICGAMADRGWDEPLWLETTEEETGRAQAEKAHAEGVDVVLVSGGDGTVMAAVSGLAGTGTPLAILPSGTGNLLARNLGLPIDLDEALATALDGASRTIDVGACEGFSFAVMAGMGFDAHVMADAPEAVKARLGWPAYVVSGLKHLRDRRMDLRISLDGAPPLRRRARSVLVGNVGTLTAGMCLLPEAEPDDGVLDVMVVRARGLLDWLRLAWAVLRHREPADAQAETFQARTVDLRVGRDEPRELDGDPIAPGRRMRVEVQPGALIVRVPATPSRT